MIRLMSVMILVCLALSSPVSYADTNNDTNQTIQSTEAESASEDKTEMPGSEQPATPPDGQPGDGQNGEQPPTPPNGQNGEMPSAPDGQPNGMPGGGSSGQPESYTAVNAYSENTTVSDQEFTSTGTDENAILVESGNTVIENGIITRESTESTGGDNSSFYGVGAAALVTGGTLTVNDTDITTDSAGGAGVFAYGDGIAYVNNCTITTEQDTSGGIHVAGGGTLYATDVTVETNGESSAAIRSDRGGGTMVVDGGSYTANGVGSPAIYVTADITVSNAELTATGSEALCLEGKNNVVLNDCYLEGNMSDLEQNDNTWTVILYQSMSGDSEVGEGSFTMIGGKLVSLNGGLFYTTNTTSEFTLNNVKLETSEDCEYLLRCTGNSNQRGWGTSGSNGADCVFTAIDQTMSGAIVWDSISNLQLSLNGSTTYTGAIIKDDSCAGEGGNGTCAVTIEAGSTWIVTGNSCITSLDNQGTILDEQGNTVAVIDADGTEITSGTSEYTITVNSSNA